MGPAGNQAEDALARLPSTNRGANFRDFAGKFHAGNLSGKPGGGGYSPGAEAGQRG